MIIAVDVGANLSSEDPSHFLGIAKRGLEISYRKLSEYVTQNADVVIEMHFRDLGMLCDAHNQKIYDRGRSKTREMLPHIKKIIDQNLSRPKRPNAPSWMMIE